MVLANKEGALNGKNMHELNQNMTKLWLANKNSRCVLHPKANHVKEK